MRQELIAISEFSANAQALGYFYQARYALFLLLKSSPDLHVSIEKLDDIAFEKEGTPIELIQTKHHTNSVSSLTNSCADLWKTLRVWSTAVLKGDVNTNEVIFTLVTTGIAPEGSIASKLYPSVDSRDSDAAVSLLNEVAQTSESKSNKSSYEAYLRLTEQQRKDMLDCVYILDASPNIVDTKEEILRELRYATRPEFKEAVFQRLEGLWFNKVIQHLSLESATTISQVEILEFINDLQEQFHQDNLPIDFLDYIGPDESSIVAHQRIFIEQLKLVMVRQPRIQKAISDYYKAFEQRSKWIRDELLFLDELEAYETRLVDEWERRFEAMKEDYEDGAELETQKAGRALFNWMDQDANIHIRPRCTEPYVMRGSYHLLSNKLQIGWHPDFLNRLEHLLYMVAEEAK
ncbi:ABC-three component system protein [Paenibacillus polymyxa]|uniref:ABC-three component system protein n=1 Tax=Paenibacillus polymyxa TaxID=1406 RepID=UPI0004DF78BB|nr:ABC-three component system protein [Paenibacillus polymyxa]MEE4577549.1 ABC-three component system protein [Paenibacillus polymyxa]